MNLAAGLSAAACVAGFAGAALPAPAQERVASAASFQGRVNEAASGQPMFGVSVTIEGATLGSVTDSTGRYRIVGVPPGPQILRAQRLGYSPTRISLVVPATGVIERDIQMARHAPQRAFPGDD